MADLREQLQTGLSDRYLLQHVLGRGGMATVYLAHDRRHDRPVALKVLHPELAHALGPERFLREIKLAARLQHPHILPLHDSGNSEGLLWYTMPYVEGESLRDRLKREIQLPIDEAVRFTSEVADALDHAHAHGLVHRDIKPENILLSGEHALVADFGVAWALESAGDDKLTATGLAVGTPTYMSPEQASAGQVDARSDIYALGCMLYEMLAGEPPYTGPTPQAILARRMLDPVPSLRTVRESVPETLEQAVNKALARAPADRFQNAVQFARAVSLSAAPTPSQSRSAVSASAATLGLYLLVSLVALALVRFATTELGLPDWVFPASVVLLLIGLPIIVATAVVQRPRAPARYGGVRPWLTWRKAIGGGVLAFAGLGAAAGGYLAMRALGVGPIGTLLATGVLKEREQVLLADFGTRQVDSNLGGVLTEALRIDLAQSPAVTLISPVQVAEVLGRMRRPVTATLEPALARDIAVREGIKGVVTGEIAKAGTQYVLSAELISAGNGDVLTAHRVTARDSTELIAAVDHLSKKLRAKIGESLRSINRDLPLERVTTASLPALRQYTAAVRAADYQGDMERALDRLQEAITLDTGFAMAYRTLGMYAYNIGKIDLVSYGYSAAIKRLDRLTDLERHLTLGDYYLIVTPDPRKAVSAYLAVLENHPAERQALNNLGNVYMKSHQFPQAESLYQRALAIDSSYVSAHNNTILVQLLLKKWRAAQASYERAIRQFPDVPKFWHDGVLLGEQIGDFAAASARARVIKERFGADPNWRGEAERHLAIIAATRGQLRDAERHSRAAMPARIEAARLDDYLAEVVLLASVIAVAGADPARALRELERALTRYPLDSLKPMDRPYLDLATVFAISGRPDRARALVAQYERLVDPRLYRKADVGLTWGRIALAERRWPEAIAKIWAAMSKETSPAFGLAELGHAYDLAGEPDSAIALYERYLDTPDFFIRAELGRDATELPSIYLRLGELYETRGEPLKARPYYSRLIELWKDCEPELRPQVNEARRRLTALSTEPTT